MAKAAAFGIVLAHALRDRETAPPSGIMLALARGGMMAQAAAFGISSQFFI